MQNKFEYIVNLLEPLAKQGQTHFSFAEILGIFEDLTGGHYDRDNLELIFTGADTERRGRVTLLEFTEELLQTEQLILTKLAELGEEIEKSTNEISKNQSMRDTHKLTERLTDAGVSADSTLSVTIGDLNISLSSREIWIECDIEGTVFKTRTERCPCAFNQTFAIPTTDSAGKLTISVKTSANVSLGHTSIPLELLKDQMSYEQTFTILSMDRRSKIGMVDLKLQWIWSKVEYFQHMLELWQDNLHTSRVSYSQMKKQALKLLAPFKLRPDFSNLVQDFVESPESSFLNEESSPSVTFKNQDLFPSEVSSINQSHADFSVNASQATSSKQSVMNLLSSAHYVSTEPSHIEIPFEGLSSHTLTLLETLVISTSLCMYMRPDFFSVRRTQLLIIGLVYLWAATNKLTYTSASLGLKAVVGSLFVDLLWFSLHSKDWAKGHNDISDGMRRFSLGMSGINFVLKGVLGVLLWVDLRKARLSS